MAETREILDCSSILYIRLLILLHVVVSFITYISAVVFGGRFKEKMGPTKEGTRVVLLITAHPDDECMFFSPMLLQSIGAKSQVHVLCLTNGNYSLTPRIRYCCMMAPHVLDLFSHHFSHYTLSTPAVLS